MDNFFDFSKLWICLCFVFDNVTEQTFWSFVCLCIFDNVFVYILIKCGFPENIPFQGIFKFLSNIKVFRKNII